MSRGADIPPTPPEIPKEVIRAAIRLQTTAQRLAKAERDFDLAADSTRLAIRKGIAAGLTEDELRAIADISADLGKSAMRIVDLQIKGEARREPPDDAGRNGYP